VIRRRAFLGTAALALLAAPGLAEAGVRRSRRVPRLGVLGEANPIPWMVRTPVVDIEARWADAERASLDDLASQLLALDVDVLVAVGAPCAAAASRRTTEVPIVAVVDCDLREAAARNVTWVNAPSEAAMAEQRLRMLRRLVPRLRRVAVAFNPDAVVSARALAQLRGRVVASGVELVARAASTVHDVEHVLDGSTPDAIDGVLILPDTSLTVHSVRLAQLTAAAGLPAAGDTPAFVDAGGLIAVHGDTGELISRTATTVARILSGAMPPAPSPPPPPRVAVNLSMAERLGVRVPTSLLAEADVLRAL
jgi:putative tryptophan/tyrosine transport system substrate-binding protein